jgi:hypothetical protein
MRKFQVSSVFQVSSLRSLAAVFVCGVVMLVCALRSPAQTINGSIGGTVTEATGATVSNATVIATNASNGFAFTTTTNQDGSYSLRFLPIGNYKVVISASGFSTKEIGPFALEIGQEVKLNVSLNVGAATTNVEVEADYQPLLNTANQTIATTLTANAIDSIPLNGRNFSSLTLFLPGSVSTEPSGLSGVNGTERDTNQAGQTSVNGNRNQTNNYYLDGIEINETVNNVIGYNPAPDALEQVQVVTANAPAEYGNVNGGDLIAQTKSGTNQFHGTAYWYLENYLLDANTWANKNNTTIIEKSHYTQPTFGGTFGGPVPFVKNLFFFIDYEGFRLPKSGSDTASVATSAMRTGDFSELTDVTLYNNSNNADGSPTPYTNNQITIVNPAATYLFAHSDLYPLPNTTAGSGSVIYHNYIGTYKKKTRNDQGDVKIDWKPNQKDTVAVRWLQGESYDGTLQAVLPITFPGDNDYPTKGIAVNEVHVFTPSLVNEFRAGFTRVRWTQGSPYDSTGVFGANGNSILGIGASQPFDGFAGLNFGCNSMTACNSLDVPSNLGNDAGGTKITDNTFQYGDKLTWQRGHHNFKGGVEITRYQQNNYYPGNYGANGYFSYYPAATMDVSNQTAGYELADFALDSASFIGRGGLDQNGDISGGNGQRQYRTGYFFQDDWKFLPNLTINLGIRYEFDQPIYEVNDKEANLNFTTRAVEYAGQNGASRALYNSTFTNFMPRVGFNYQPNAKTVVRGGFGMTNYLEGTGANLRLTYNSPYWNEVSGTGTVPTSSSAGTFYAVENGYSAGSSTSLAGSTYRAWYKVKPSVISEWNLALEYELNHATSVTATYLGEVGQHLIQAVAYNQLTTPCQVNGTYGDYGPTSDECAAVDPAPWYNIVGQNGSVVGTTSEGIMKYNALQMSVRQRASHGLEYTVNYTWSHALTNSVGFFGVSSINGPSAYAQNAYDNKAEYGPSGMDVRHSINGVGVYELPFGRGRQFGAGWGRGLDEVAGGWKLAATGVYYAGFPVTISGTDNSMTGAHAARPNQYRKLHVTNRSIDHWFGTDASASSCATRGVDDGTCAYGNTGYGTFGTAHVGTERAPGFTQFDISAYKDLQIWKDHKITFRVDAFNAFNITSYGNPDNGYADSNFGQITSVRSSPRQFQLAARYAF